MSIIASQNNQNDYELPPQGVHHAVCVDVVDMGMIDGQYGPKHKCRIAFQLQERMSDGRPYLVSRRFTLSLADQSHLKPFLEMWRSRAFTPEELKGFDLERLVGANAMIQILHNPKGENTYANIVAAFPVPTGTAQLKPDGYTRVKDRDQQPQAQHTAQAAASAAAVLHPGRQQQQQQQQQQAGQPFGQGQGGGGRIAPLSQIDDDDIPF